MMVEGELMSVLRKPMSQFSGQELTDSRLPGPLPDPYAHEPPRPSTLNLRTDCPYTAEPDPAALLAAGCVTPNELHYVRNHMPAPVLRSESYSLTIEGPGVHSSSSSSSGGGGSSSSSVGSVVLSLDDLQTNFEQHSVLATLQCAGNRRNDMWRFKEVKGGPWEACGIGTAVWTGPLLTDVLAAAGVDTAALLQQYEEAQQRAQQQLLQALQTTLQAAAPAGVPASSKRSATGTARSMAAQQPHAAAEEQIDVQFGKRTVSASNSNEPVVSHVWLEGWDSAGPDSHFLVSIPVGKALSSSGDVILALRMNGQELPGQHGYPVRAVVPGHAGVRSCKWLKRILLSPQEAPSHWQQSDYKMLPPSNDWQVKANWQAVPAMQAMPVQSAFLQPKPGETLKPGITAAGYAWSGGGNSIIRVEVSADAGKTWVSLQLQNPGGVQQPEGRAWAWVFWEARVPVMGLAAKVVGIGQVINAVLGAGVRGGSSSRGIANDGDKELGASTQDPSSSCCNEATFASNMPAGAGDADNQKACGSSSSSSGGSAGGAQQPRVVVLQVKAVDAQYCSQPSDVGSIWNMRGVGCNAWHTVEVTVDG